MISPETMDELIQSMNGGAHVSPDLQALQDYLNQNIRPQALSFNSASTTYRALPPSRSTSISRQPPHQFATHTHSLSHESYLPNVYATPLQTPIPGEEPPSHASRPHSLRRSSSYGFGMNTSGSQSRATSPYTEFSAFEGDAFAPLVQPECPGPSDPWARWKQQSPESASAWSSFGTQHTQPKMAAFAGGKQYNHHQPNQFVGFGFGRYQSPQRSMGRVERPPTPPDEDDEMMDAEMTQAMQNDEDEEEAVERAMGLGMEDDPHIVRPESAPGALGMWREQGFTGYERGRRVM